MNKTITKNILTRILRNDYGVFRLDRIGGLLVQNQTIEPHKMTIDEYFDTFRKKCSPLLT